MKKNFQIRIGCIQASLQSWESISSVFFKTLYEKKKMEVEFGLMNPFQKRSRRFNLVNLNKQIPMMTFYKRCPEGCNFLETFFSFYYPSAIHDLTNRKLVILRIGRQSLCFLGRECDVTAFLKQDVGKLSLGIVKNLVLEWLWKFFIF